MKYLLLFGKQTRCASHPARGAWIEIAQWIRRITSSISRTPQGVRGLKFLEEPGIGRALVRRTPQGVRGLKSWRHNMSVRSKKSHPARGAWIEIVNHSCATMSTPSHPARGAWIEMALADHIIPPRRCRTPQGVRGLKFLRIHNGRNSCLSHPARGAWIEISSHLPPLQCQVSHPARGAWIEISIRRAVFAAGLSHPARGAWIEMAFPPPRRSSPGSRTPQGVRGLK